MDRMCKHAFLSSRWRFVLSLCLLLSYLSPVLAFEGDYIWEERFKARLARAQSGLANEQYAVGDMYFRGRGTAVDPTKALNWFLLAAKQGHVKAAYRAGYLYLYNEELTHAPKLALPLLKMAAESGYVPAQYELGKLLFSGAGGERDESQALQWLVKAKAADYAPARAAFEQTVKRLVREKSQSASSAASARTRGQDKAQIVTVDLPDPKGIILRSKWGSREGPSTFLPSKLTHCRESGAGIECLSSKLDMQLASTRVVYRTRAKITHINPDGQFRLAYANNVLSADTQSSSTEVAVKEGWQRNEHVLECSLVAGRTISCAQGTSKQYRFFGR